MATLNAAVSTNNANQVLWSLSTKLEYRSDRKTSTTVRGGLITSVNNLGVGVTKTNPFTNML